MRRRNLRILTIGDSITLAGLWQQELARLALQDAGVTLDIRNEGVGGSRTTHWPDVINSLLTKHQPDLVTFFTGTNDDPNETKFGESATAWAWRSTVEAIHTFRTPPIKVVPALIGYSDPLVAADWLLANEPRTNDTIYAQWGHYPADWFAGITNFQVMPGTPDFLDTSGIHPNPRGYKTMGRIVYDAIASSLGWPGSSEPPLCGLWGHRKGYSPPAYVPCTSP